MNGQTAGRVRWYRAYRCFGRAAVVVEEVARFVQWRRLADTVVSLRVERQVNGGEFYLFLALETDQWGELPPDVEETLEDCRSLTQAFGDALTLEDIQGMASGDLQVRALGQCLTYRALVQEAFEDPFEEEARVLALDAAIPNGAGEKLLWFLSATGAGSWSSLRAAAAALGITSAGLVSRTVRHLRLLGHLEVFPGGRWVIAPPGVVEGECQGQPVRFLVGARDARTGGMAREEQAGGPDRVLVAPDAEAPTCPPSLGCAAHHLLQVLPEIGEFRVGLERPGSVNAARDVTGRLEGHHVKPGRFTGTAGLYALREENRTRHALFLEEQWWAGEFFTLRFLAQAVSGHLHPWRYDRTQQELAVRHEERLPELYERVLVLCCGLLPEHRGGWLVYRHVPVGIVTGLSVLLDVAMDLRPTKELQGEME